MYSMLSKKRNGKVCGGILLFLFFLNYALEKQTKTQMILLNKILVNGTKNEVLVPTRKETIQRTHIAFLKIPKTASSTMACIFLAFGFKHNLTMFLPRKCFVNDEKQSYILEKKIHFDIFVIHTIYNHTFFTNIVRDPAIITIVRNPEQRFVSHAFFFLKYQTRFKNLSSQVFINEIVNNLEKYHTHNIMSNYFRIPMRARERSENMQKALKKIKSEFTLVLVLERLDESLVLMKRLFNWSFASILYRKTTGSNRHHVSLNITQKKQIRRANGADYEVYNFFSTELNKKITDAGQNFQEEVSYFRYVLEEFKHFCADTLTTSKKYIFSSSKWESNLVVSKTDCDNVYKYHVKDFKSRNYTVL